MPFPASRGALETTPTEQGRACGGSGIKPQGAPGAEQSTCALEGERAAWEVMKQKKKKEIRKQAGLADLHPKQVSAHLKGNLLIATEAV